MHRVLISWAQGGNILLGETICYKSVDCRINLIALRGLSRMLNFRDSFFSFPTEPESTCCVYLKNYSPAFSASVATTAMFRTRSCGRPCRCCRYSGLL